MNVRPILDEIAARSGEERAKLIEFVHRFEAGRQPSGSEPNVLTERLAASTDEPDRVNLLREETARGFYGGAPHA